MRRRYNKKKKTKISPCLKKNLNRKQYEPKVIVLDDEFDLASVAKQILQKHGFKNVFAFTNPLLALEHLKINHKDYSLIVSDIRMPMMSGFEFVERVRKINPKVKILLMTAFEIDDNELARVLPRQEINGLIRKPASSTQILNTISKIL